MKQKLKTNEKSNPPMNFEIKNAVIESASITIEQGLSSWIMLDYGGSGQGFGGYFLHAPKSWKSHKVEWPYAGHFLTRVMEIAGVEKWEHLRGKTIRVKCDHRQIHAVGHIVKDDWFCPDEDFKNLRMANGE